MDAETRSKLNNLAKHASFIFNSTDKTTPEETRREWHTDVAAIQAYASCQIALQLARIADVLEEMYQSPANK